MAKKQKIKKSNAHKKSKKAAKTINLDLLRGIILLALVGIFIGTLGYMIQQRLIHRTWVKPPLEPKSNSGIRAAERFYGKEVRYYANKYHLPYEYFMAIIMLESSGARNPRPRFERHVYRSLKAVKEGRLKDFEGITQKELRWLSDKQLKKLATSYGPFQIMGYKIYHLGISDINDLNNRNAIKYGIQWINQEYGWLLRQHRYKDAFHYHNTGHLYPADGKPRTTSPTYVSRGLKYMKIFKALEQQEKHSKK